MHRRRSSPHSSIASSYGLSHSATRYSTMCRTPIRWRERQSSLRRVYMYFTAKESADRAPQRALEKNDSLRVEGRRASLISPTHPPGSAGVSPASCFTATGAGGTPALPGGGYGLAAHSFRLSWAGPSMQKPFLAADSTSAVDRANDDIGEAMRLRLFRTQVELREAEQRAFDLFLQNLVKGTSHLSLGQEAIAAGFANAMKPGDLSFCTYRGHAHTLARGVPVEKVLGELMQRDNGLMRGKGGSMHLTSAEHGVMGSYAIIGAHLPIACGAALRAQYKGEDDVTVCFFGDGTTNIGAFHEALNFAAIWKLPFIFVCENNLYMEYTPIGDVTAVPHPAADRASAYGLPKIVIDGNDADAVYRTAQKAFVKARAGGGPSLIECMTYRHSGHSRADPAKYRPEGELDKWKERDPIKIYRERLKQFGVSDKTISDIDADVKRRVDEATEKCKAAPPPPLELLTADVYADGGFAWRN